MRVVVQINHWQWSVSVINRRRGGTSVRRFEEMNVHHASSFAEINVTNS